MRTDGGFRRRLNGDYLTLINTQDYHVQVHRCYFGSLQQEAILPSLTIFSQSIVVVLLAHGGYFAGLVCQGGRPLAHVTLHRYVVRKKQGGRQVVKDQSKGGISSVGSALRRHHELRLQEDVQLVLGRWAGWLRSGTRYFPVASHLSTIIVWNLRFFLLLLKSSTNFAGPRPRARKRRPANRRPQGTASCSRSRGGPRYA